MPTKKDTRNCKDCKCLIPFVARKIRCIDCYKRHINHLDVDPITLFINDD